MDFDDENPSLFQNRPSGGPLTQVRHPVGSAQDGPIVSKGPPKGLLPPSLRPKVPVKPKRQKAEPPPSVEGGLLTAEEVAALLRVSTKSLEHMRRRGTGPAHVCLGEGRRCVRYRREDIKSFMHDLQC